ncbi:MAG: hypothetical protein HY553_06825 [Elusimicrobia bacterium]|nr:hypothetical protein [Elusimicrobiota bacterium]
MGFYLRLLAIAAVVFTGAQLLAGLPPQDVLTSNVVAAEPSVPLGERSEEGGLAEKTRLRSELEGLIRRDFDAQLKRLRARAEARREEAKLLDEEATRRESRRDTIIQDKLRQVLDQDTAWDL